MEFEGYEIVGVYDVDNRENKESHQRMIGRFCSYIYIEIGFSMFYHYDGYKSTVTSEVESWFDFGDEIWVITKNSIYRFEKVVVNSCQKN